MIYLRKRRALLPFLLSGMLTLSLLTGCGGGDGGNGQTVGSTESAADAGAATGSGMAADTAASAGTEAAAAAAGTESAGSGQTGDLPMDPSAMKPWINSEVIGMVTEDTEADEKDDFYLAVNRDWILNAKLRPGYSSETAMIHATMAQVQERCIGLVTNPTLTGWDAEIIQAYYKLWLDWDGRNEAGLTPFMPAFEKLEDVQTLDEMTDFLLSEEYFYWGMFPAEFIVKAAASDSSVHEVSIRPAELSLGDTTDYEKTADEMYAEGSSFADVCTYMLGRLGREEEAERVVKNAYSFEAELAAHELSFEEDSDQDAIRKKINPVTMEELGDLSPAFPLCAYMEQYGWAVSDRINLDQPEWLAGLNEAYTEDNLPRIRDWALSKLLTNVIRLSDEEAYREQQKIDRVYSGLDEDEPDEQIAFEECKDNFPDEFARVYIDQYITEEDRAQIEQICREVIATYREMLSKTEWLSEETRQMAVRKLDNMEVWSLYPDKWVDESPLHITPKEEGGSYAQACMEYAKGVHQIYLNDLNQPVDREIWPVAVLESNASYMQEHNAFCIQAGFLGDAVWRSDMSIEEKYGTIGCVIGHEISHAFDTNGAQFDENGTVRDWWTPEDKQVFTERAQKLEDYFSRVAAFDDGTPYPASVVKAEAIADMAGMKCILKMAEKVDGFDYDRFFRANAAMWARIDTLEKARWMLGADPHPFNYLRADITVQQFDEFQETYGVKKGDGMYLAPEDRILVW